MDMRKLSAAVARLALDGDRKDSCHGLMLSLGPQRLRSIGLFASCALVVGLSLRLIALNQAYATLRMRFDQPHAGDAVPAFHATSVSGDTFTVGENADIGARQVLFVLTTTCAYCKATLPVWAKLADSLVQLNDGRIRVIAISLDSLAQSRRYVADHRIRYPMVMFPNERLRRVYRARSVPQTVVVDAEGVVLYAHVGQLRVGPTLDSVYHAATWLPPPASGGPSVLMRRDTAGAIQGPQ